MSSTPAGSFTVLRKAHKTGVSFMALMRNRHATQYLDLQALSTGRFPNGDKNAQ